MNNLILGLDLSSTKCGYCLLWNENKKNVRSGVINLGANLPLNERIKKLNYELHGLPLPNLIYVERLNPTTSRQVSFTFGAVMGCVWSVFPFVQEVKPIEWRKIVYRNLREWDIKGLGRQAQKALAIKEVERRFNYTPKDDNEAEAILIAVAGSVLG